MANIRYSPLAQDDLMQMWEYIAGELASPEAADNVTRKVTGTVRILERHPLSGESVEARSGRKTDLRYLVGADRVIVYRYDKDSDWVSILRVFGKGTNWIDTLFRSQMGTSVTDYPKA